MIPTPVRPKPVASGVPGGAVPPRPVASAAPGAGALEERRRDKAGKKRKKGRKSLVDQEAVAQNISRTLASIKGRWPAKACASAKKAPASAICRRKNAPPRRSARRPRARQRVHHGQRAREHSQDPAHADRHLRLQESRADGHDQSAARLRPDRADRRRSASRRPKEEEYAVAAPEQPVDQRRDSAARVRRSSRSWVTSTTARRRCSTTSARRTSSPAKPAASRSTSARITSR